MQNTLVKDIMTADLKLISEDASLEEAAAKMQKIDSGVLPVGEEGNIKGIITDRDIIIRAIANGTNPSQARVSDYMTTKIYSCKDTDTLNDAADQMRKNHVSRLIVKDKQGNVAGILSFGCILRKNANTNEIAEVVAHATGKKLAS